MLKLIYLITICTFSLSCLSAKEDTLAILTNVTSNGVQKFNIGNSTFLCDAYGVLTLEKLYENSNIDSKCQDTIKNFYKKYPPLKYYTESVLSVQQMYHIEFKNQECVVYAKGQKILSEILLEEGLAVKNPLFKDQEFGYAFDKAQLNARFHKRGLWQEEILGACVDSLYKE